jgi:hypothetical protein
MADRVNLDDSVSSGASARHRVKVVSGLAPLLLAVGAAWAQPASISATEKARALQLLHSVPWMDKAWGAYFAGRLHAEQLREPLIEEFRGAGALRDAPSYSEEYAFVAALFDAAIEANITVPAVLLEPFEEKWSDPVLILLARDKDAEEPLLRFAAEKSRNAEWLAANNLLFAMKSQRWYSGMLAELNITNQFIVTDPGEGGTGGGKGGIVCGDGVAAMPKGFPPITIHTLQERALRGSVLLAPGPQSIYDERTIVPTDKQVGFGSCSTGLDRAAYRIKYLAEIANMPGNQAENLFHRAMGFSYRGTEDFEREVEQDLTAQEQGIRQVLQSAKVRGLDYPADLRLRIVPEVIDRRQNATEPLPVVTPREIAFP